MVKLGGTHAVSPARLDHVQCRLAFCFALDDRVGPGCRDWRVPTGENDGETKRSDGRVQGVGLQVQGEALGKSLRVPTAQRENSERHRQNCEREMSNRKAATVLTFVGTRMW